VKIRELEEPKAEERQKEAGIYGIEGGRGHKKEETLPAKWQEGFEEEQGEVAEKIAPSLGWTPRTYQ